MTAKGTKLTYIPLIIKDGILVDVMQRGEVAKATKIWENIVLLYMSGDKPVGWHL